MSLSIEIEIFREFCGFQVNAALIRRGSEKWSFLGWMIFNFIEDSKGMADGLEISNRSYFYKYL